MSLRDQLETSIALGDLGVPTDLSADEALGVIARLAGAMRGLLLDLGVPPARARSLTGFAVKNAVSTKGDSQ